MKFIEGSFLGVAEAMPENKYDFIPTGGNFEGVRSFGEQVKHVACAQFGFFNEFEGKQPPADCEKGGHNPAKTKAELIQYLKDSFDYGNRVLSTLNAKNALDRVEGRYAGPNTKLGISVIAVWHITDHYGQMVEYLRMNGLVPPMTQKYALKVR
ncbi:MAG TPA: DinB family protein [Terriglobales bacterium]|nr:DinB family protein [Terriglobales bacterium]